MTHIMNLNEFGHKSAKRVDENVSNTLAIDIERFYENGKALFEKLKKEIVEILKRHNGVIYNGEIYGIQLTKFPNALQVYIRGFQDGQWWRKEQDKS